MVVLVITYGLRYHLLSTINHPSNIILFTYLIDFKSQILYTENILCLQHKIAEEPLSYKQ